MVGGGDRGGIVRGVHPDGRLVHPKHSGALNEPECHEGPLPLPARQLVHGDTTALFADRTGDVTVFDHDDLDGCTLPEVVASSDTLPGIPNEIAIA